MTKQRAYIVLAATDLVVLAVVGWTADAARWALAGVRARPAGA